MNKGIFAATLACGALIGAVVVGSSRKAYNAICKGKTAVLSKAEEVMRSQTEMETDQTEPF